MKDYMTYPQNGKLLDVSVSPKKKYSKHKIVIMKQLIFV